MQYQHLICFGFSLCSAETMLSFLGLKQHWVLQPGLVSDVSRRGFGWLPTIHTPNEFPLTVDTGMAFSIMEVLLPFLLIKGAFRARITPLGSKYLFIYLFILCCFKENVSWTVLEVSSHLNCEAKRNVAPDSFCQRS